MAEKKCICCGILFEYNSNRQIRCSPCQKLEKARISREYYALHIKGKEKPISYYERMRGNNRRNNKTLPVFKVKERLAKSLKVNVTSVPELFTKEVILEYRRIMVLNRQISKLFKEVRYNGEEVYLQNL